MKKQLAPRPAAIKKNGYMVDVSFHLTRGEAMALFHALEQYAEHSCVCNDVFSYLQNAEDEASIKLDER